jgi:hypothetical protein
LETMKEPDKKDKESPTVQAAAAPDSLEQRERSMPKETIDERKREERK